MIDVDMQGTGVNVDGKFIKLVSKKSELEKKIFRYAYVDKITGKSGRELTHEQSIAVDPDVIPLGKVVCIEGYGERTADDTGTAITGNKIDLFMNVSRADALAFGVKNNITVYEKR